VIALDDDAAARALAATDGPRPAYATFARRLLAMLYDSASLMVVIALAVSLVAFGEPFSGAGRVAAAAIVLSVLLYEPVMVARFGGTLGHRRRNMRVIADATGRSPGIARAFARFALKTVLGLPSFVAMATTIRHQALHDQLTGTSVQIHDLAVANESDYRYARPMVPRAARASGLRRGLMVMGYCAAIALLCIIVLGLGISHDCLDAQRCSRTDRAVASWIPWCWLLGSMWAAITGWQGRLPGTHAAHRAPSGE
jgi:uncharacterized RDD family membrane protein YckC